MIGKKSKKGEEIKIPLPFFMCIRIAARAEKEVFFGLVASTVDC